MDHASLSARLEASVMEAALWLKLCIEAVSVAIVLAAILVALTRLARDVRANGASARIGLARCLSLALEFQLAADIVGTAVSPDWEQIGKLAAVAAIRTFLNVFLQRELAHEEGKATPR